MITPKFLQHIQEAEFLDVIGTKVFKLVCNVNIVYGNFKSENSQDYVQKRQRYCAFMNSASGKLIDEYAILQRMDEFN
jgi:hypothetical protein